MTTTAGAAMITGAAGNLGRAVATVLADDFRLALVGSNLAHLRTTFPQAPATWRLVDVDLAKQEASDKRLGEVISDIGPVDVLCSIAGGFQMGEPVHAMAASSFNAMIDVNVRTLLNAVRAVAPGMIARGRGRIITVGAMSAQRGLAEMGAYAAAKSAVMRLTESMAAELGPKGINVNGVLPSVIDTPQNRAAMPGADPAGWVKPQDLAAVIGFLASERAVAVNGALIPVTGRG